MKMTTPLLAAAFLLILAPVAIGQEAEKPKAEVEAVTLRWDFVKDEARRFRAVQTMKQSIDFGTGPSEVLNVSTTEWTDKCVGFTDDDAVKLEYHYDRIVLKVETGDVKVNYDSAKPDEAELEKLPQLKGTAMLAGKEFTYEVTRDLKVRNLKGWDKLREQVLKEFDPIMREQMEPSFADAARIAQLEAAFRAVPKTKVKPGEEWKDSFKEPAGTIGVVVIDLTYKLDTVESVDGKSVATVTTKGEGKFEKFEEGEFSDWKVTMDGFEYTGAFSFDLKRGCAVKQSTSSKFKMEFVTESMTMTQSVEIEFTIELLPEKEADPETPKPEEKAPEEGSKD